MASEIVGPASRFYVSQRLRLHYVDWGNEDRPLLLLVHGGRDHARSWDAVARDYVIPGIKRASRAQRLQKIA